MNSFQIITLYGSRQVGKTTTIDALFGENFDFVTLNDSEELDLAEANPKAFLDSHPWSLIIDEVQKAVGLLNEIKNTAVVRVFPSPNIWICHRKHIDRLKPLNRLNLFTPAVFLDFFFDSPNAF
jgi:predicted AAA+ superfamily ATPase